MVLNLNRTIIYFIPKPSTISFSVLYVPSAASWIPRVTTVTIFLSETLEINPYVAVPRARFLSSRFCALVHTRSNLKVLQNKDKLEVVLSQR